MHFLHPKLRPILEASRGQPTLAELSVEAARQATEERGRARPPGPNLPEVNDLRIEEGLGIPIRIYKPEKPIGVALAFHGGGWIVGSIDSFDDVARHIAHHSGVAVVSVGYRRAPEYVFPAALDDAWRALKWIAANGDSLGLPVERLMLLGDSAGANLAAVLALMARNAGAPSLALQVLVYPILDAQMRSDSIDEYANGYFISKSDIEHIYRTYGVGSVVQAEDWRVSPLHAKSHDGLAPALIISAECDPVKDDAIRYARRLMEAGVPTTHVTYSAVTHLFFGMRSLLQPAKDAQGQVAYALRSAALSKGA